MARYQIWNKTDTIYTQAGEALSPAQWISRYKWISIPSAVPVISGGVINGGFIGELDAMVELYSSLGCDFSHCQSNEDKLAAIEAYEDRQSEAADLPSAEERIAAALEFQVLSALPDSETI